MERSESREMTPPSRISPSLLFPYTTLILLCRAHAMAQECRLKEHTGICSLLQILEERLFLEAACFYLFFNYFDGLVLKKKF
jgi:hypothetical protein